MTDSPSASPPDGAKTPIVRITLGARLKAYLFAGMLVTAPVAVTLYIAWNLISFVDEKVGSVLPHGYSPNDYLPFSIPGVGLLVLLVFLVLVGMLAAGFLGRFVIGLSESILARMPVVRSIYSAVKQIFETVLKSQSNAFRQVVLVQFPHPGAWTLGLISGSTQGEVAEKLGQHHGGASLVTVFVPTTPNPTSGYILFVRETDVIALDMTVDDGLKFVVSGGIVTPPMRDKIAEYEKNAVP
ncbi:DUF502 domain-containing protein [Novispirillum itersonii]|uniref:Putative membrane protein n=1 Tax=Novispirillum itersonii TaxID=189 RepID=A0A7W9ZEF6_NOVIT|nr:DUF502 domain-containing protein [Novispirillum itersonii]MBB6209996.1 putative membrane protein [Novispirillum itersonii]